MITTAAAGYINRNTSSWFDPRLDWTKLLIFRYNSALAGDNNIWTYSNDATFTQKYITLANGTSGTETLLVQAYNGIVTQTTVSSLLVAGTNYKLAIRYTAATHLLEFIINSVVVGSVTIDLSAFSPATNDYTLNEGTSDSVSSIGYERLFQRVLTLAEITIEQASIAAVSTTNLLSSCPLQASIDLTDHNGNNRQFTATGTITTDTSDPLLSVVVGPPTNISPATAITITTASAYFQDTLTAGSATDVWHKCTAIADFIAMSACAFGDLVTYKPTITVYEGLANANSGTKLALIAGGQNNSIQFPSTSGLDYYFKSTRNGAVTPATLQLSVLNFPNTAFNRGDIFVNDDTTTTSPGYVASILDVEHDYKIKRAVIGVAVGEGGDILSNGFILLEELADAGNSFFKRYNISFQLVTTIDSGTNKALAIRANRTQNNWITATGGAANALVRTINADGTVGSTTWTLTGNALILGIATNPAQTILYFSKPTDGDPVKTWDLVGNVAGANLLAGIANYRYGDMLTLPNGNLIIVSYHPSATRNFNIYHVSPAGAILGTYAGTVYPLGTPPRLAYSLDLSTTFWLWNNEEIATVTTGIVRAIQITISTMAVAITRTYRVYDNGVYKGTAVNTPERFGTPNSCPFMILTSESATAKSGLYYIDDGRFSGSGVRKPDDTYWDDVTVGTTTSVAILNPFVEGYAAGDE